VHAPSIDLSSVAAPGIVNGLSVPAANGSPAKRGIVRKASKLSLLKKGKEKEKDEESGAVNGLSPNREKDLPHRPISSAVDGTSTSSGFLHVPSPGPDNAEEHSQNDNSLTPTATNRGAGAALQLEPETESNQTITGADATTPTANHPTVESPPRDGTLRAKYLPPLPKDRAASPTPATPLARTHAEAETAATFEHRPVNDMSVRFDINLVKVPLLPLHGIQFRRAGGDGWQYQMLARRVLTELKL